jgi:hypothetical protein
MNHGMPSLPNNLGAQNLFNVVRPPSILVTGNIQATANNHYVFTNNTTTTSIILPLNPTPGLVIWVTNASNLFTHFCNRNGQRINGLAENLFLDVANQITVLRWVDTTTGWLAA